MSKKIKKFLDFEVRAVEGEPRTYWFTASTPSRDRMGDIIVQEGWRTQDFLKTGGPILWGHDYYSPPIGRGKEVAVSPNSLDIKVEFVPADIDPYAAMIEKLVAGGWIRTGSVGFQVYKREPLNADDLKQRPELKWGERLYGELLEFSIVPVPANPEALAQKEFVEAVGRAYGMKMDEAVSKFLPYKDEKGNVNPRLLRASLAASLGARGGVKIIDADQKACENHLRRIAKENGIEVACKGAAELREAFSDVWHEELLDVIQRASEDEEATTLSLIKGDRRKDLIQARDAINVLLKMSEDESPRKPVEPEPDVQTAGVLAEMAAINASLKGTQKILSGN